MDFHNLSMKKRKLSQKEIDYILKDIPSLIPANLDDDLKSNFVGYIIDSFRHDLENIETYKSNIDLLKKQLEKYMQSSIIRPGESVGVICAQSIGERQTQLTLNSFHQSGMTVATVTTGVPRFLEVLNATKEPKTMMNSFFLRGETGNLNVGRKTIGNHLKYCCLKDLVERESIFLEKEDEPWYDSFEMFYSNEFRAYQSCISFKLKAETLFHYQIYPLQIKERLEEEFDDIFVVFSPLHYLQLDVFIDLSSIIEDMQEEYAIAHEAGQDLKEHVHVSIFIQEVLRPKLKNTFICGIDHIQNFYLTIVENRIKVDTEGCNMYDILCLPFVEQATVKTNHMWEVLEVVGIEGVRKFLLDELFQIVSSDGTYINPCHLLLLVDIMTFHGYIQSISRYGMKKDMNSILTKSSFEESLDHFSKASFFGEKEDIHSVSASIMCGKRSQIGTGKVGLAMDLRNLN